MNRITSLSRIYALILLLAMGCKKEDTLQDQTETQTHTIQPPIDNVNASVYGKVLDQNNEAMIDVSVVLNGNSVQTNNHGLFHFRDVVVNSYGNTIVTNKEGYFESIKIIETSEGASAYIELRLIEKKLIETISSIAESEVVLDGKSKVVFQSNSFIDSQGNPYSGDVNVFAERLDPTTSNTVQMMPGDLTAFDSSNEFVQLAIFGMFVIKLESPSGEELNLVTHLGAELSFELPSELESDAPETISLWSFDELSGYWIEDGIATLHNGKYVGNVSHFSFWSCSIAFPLVTITGRIVDSSNNGLANIHVEIGRGLGCPGRLSWTDAHGYYHGKIPKDEILYMRIYNSCKELVLEEQIGPFVEDVTMPTLDISDSMENILFSGSLYDCGGEPVSNGFVVVGLGDYDQVIFVENDGSFSGLINVCDLIDVGVIGVDAGVEAISTPIVVPTELENIDLGIITACEDLQEFYYFIIDTTYSPMMGIDIFITSDQDGKTVYSINDIWNISDHYTEVKVIVDNGPGEYHPYFANVIPYNTITASCESTSCEDFILSFSELGDEPGETVKGSVRGVLNSLIGPIEVTGAFRGIVE